MDSIMSEAHERWSASSRNQDEVLAFEDAVRRTIVIARRIKIDIEPVPRFPWVSDSIPSEESPSRSASQSGSGAKKKMRVRIRY